MKKFRFLAIIVAILAVLIISVPATANSTQPLIFNIQGIEISPGIDIGNYNIGATFVGKAISSEYTGVMSTSVNYTPKDPVPNSTNIFVGGSWSLTVTQSGKVIGYISGRIPWRGGSVTWNDDDDDNSGPNNGTEIGTVSTSLNVTIARGIFYGITSGTFIGADDHVTGLFIGGIEVPTIAGTLTLYY
jgi:hypothetical protein